MDRSPKFVNDKLVGDSFLFTSQNGVKLKFFGVSLSATSPKGVRLKFLGELSNIDNFGGSDDFVPLEATVNLSGESKQEVNLGGDSLNGANLGGVSLNIPLIFQNFAVFSHGDNSESNFVGDIVSPLRNARSLFCRRVPLDKTRLCTSGILTPVKTKNQTKINGY